MLMVHVINIIGVKITNHSVYYKKISSLTVADPLEQFGGRYKFRNFIQDGTLLYSIADVHMV